MKMAYNQLATFIRSNENFFKTKVFRIKTTVDFLPFLAFLNFPH